MKIYIAIFTTLIFISCSPQPNEHKGNEPQASQITQKSYFLNDLTIDLIQEKGDGKVFYCKSKLLISKNNQVIDSIHFTPDPVGGFYGISRPHTLENHLVFTKHGDYDGLTLIVNTSGKIFSIIGGKNFYDPVSKNLFSIYESDLSGFAVFNLESDSLLIKMSDLEAYPKSFHKAFGERYFISSSDNNGTLSIWEIEFALERIMQVALDSSTINQSNRLHTWEVENAYCECEQ